MEFQLFTDVRGQWRWRLQAANNRTIANSGEAYYNRTDCERAIILVKGSLSAPVRLI